MIDDLLTIGGLGDCAIRLVIAALEHLRIEGITIGDDDDDDDDRSPRVLQSSIKWRKHQSPIAIHPIAQFSKGSIAI
jgi:hypothetical protein